MLAKPIEYVSQKLPMYIQMLELPRCLGSNAVAPVCPAAPVPAVAKPVPPVVPPVPKVAEPVVEALESAACKVEEKVAAAKAVAETVAETVAEKIEDKVEAVVSPLLPEVTTPAALPEKIAAEEKAICEEAAKPEVPACLDLLPSCSGADIDPEANRCFIETVSQPHLNVFTYELDIPH